MSEDRKPLELDVWQSATCREAGCPCAMGRECPGWMNPRTGEWIEEGCEPYTRRLTDAELAAEWWKANSEGWCSDALHGTTYDPSTGKLSNRDHISHRIEVLERFATHPHYDEE